jgi:SAM-dependent methyltransferase
LIVSRSLPGSRSITVLEKRPTSDERRDQPGSVDPEWWRSWFDEGYLALYDPIVTPRAAEEVDALERLLGLEPPLRVLDLACGQGRHSIELARRGYDVTGLDLSSVLLAEARRRAAEAGVNVRWIQADMREAPREDFDLCLSLFTSFGYFAEDADNDRVLEAAWQSLRRSGRFVLEVLNAAWKIGTFQPHSWFPFGDVTVIEDQELEGNRLRVRWTLAKGEERSTRFHALRLYRAAELEEMLRLAGFRKIELYGSWEGEPVTTASHRVLAIATR